MLGTLRKGKEIVGLLPICGRLEILVAIAAHRHHDPDRICARRFHPELPFPVLNEGNGFLLADFPLSVRVAANMSDPLVRIEAVTLVDTLDLTRLRLR